MPEDGPSAATRGRASPRAWPCGPGCGRCWRRPSGPRGRARSGPRRRPSPASPRGPAAPTARRSRGGGPRSRRSPSRHPRRRRRPRGSPGQSPAWLQSWAPKRARRRRHPGQSSRWSWTASIATRNVTRCWVLKRAIDALGLGRVVGVVAVGEVGDVGLGDRLLVDHLRDAPDRGRRTSRRRPGRRSTSEQRGSRRRLAGQRRPSALLITIRPSGSSRYQITAWRGAPSGSTRRERGESAGGRQEGADVVGEGSGSGMAGSYGTTPRPARRGRILGTRRGAAAGGRTEASMELDGLHVAVLAGEGVEDLEYWVTVMRLREEGARVTSAGLARGDGARARTASRCRSRSRSAGSTPTSTTGS